MGKIIFRKIRHSNFASIGIGAMIVFIAMVLVAGIAASVLIQTSVMLESQSLSTGRGTQSEVATGLCVYNVEAYAAPGQTISKLAIMIRPRAGSEVVDLSQTYIEISDFTHKIVLNYSTSYFSNPPGLDNIFNSNAFPEDLYPYGDASNRDGTQYGVIIMDDFDGSITQNHPVVNKGDKVYLCVNTTGALNGILEQTTIEGQVVPEIGFSAPIHFTTPNTYITSVMELYWDM